MPISPAAVPLGVAAAMRNLGQSCSAPTRMLVSRAGDWPRSRPWPRQQQGNSWWAIPLAEETTHGPIANRAQFDRIQAMIETGIAEGAKLVIGGPGRPEGLATGLYARPTIFSDVRRDMRIAQEEIFGPVLAIMAYDTVDEAVEIANDTVYGLGAHVQGTDMEQVRHVASEIRVRAGASQLPGLGPERAVRRLQAFGERPRIRPRGYGGVPGNEGRPRLLSVGLSGPPDALRTRCQVNARTHPFGRADVPPYHPRDGVRAHAPGADRGGLGRRARFFRQCPRVRGAEHVFPEAGSTGASRA